MSTNPGQPWEKTLQSWTPRRPSKELRKALFGPSSEVGLPRGESIDPDVLLSFNWRWLMPATALFMSLLILVGRESDGMRFSGISPEIATSLAMTQPSLSTYLAPSIHTAHNAWSDASFASTSSRPALSTPLSFAVTNSARP